ncbi:MAG: PEP-CTERM sorting domain-containing protein [Planctomycetota bacterium]
MTRFANLSFVLCLGFITSITAASAMADIAVYYDFAGGSASQTSGSLTGSDLSAGGWLDGAGVASTGISAGTETTFVRTPATGTTTADGDTLAEAIAAESYYGFTLTNTSGSDVELESVGFNYWFTSGFTGADFRIYAMSSLAGFTSGNEHGFGQVLDNSRPTAGDQVFESFDITALGSLASGSSVDFRFYFVDNSTSNPRIHRLDDVTITTVNQIPEPASAALLGIGAIGFVLRRRR